MNWFKRLFKKGIYNKDLEKLIFALGKNKKFIDKIYESPHGKYASKKEYSVFGTIDVKKSYNGTYLFDLDISRSYLTWAAPIGTNYREGSTINIKKTISYEELSKNPVLKQYVKGKSLEKSLAVLSVASILASAFFISNNITGNAILTANANSSGIIGTGLFVLGVASFLAARNF